MDCFSFSAMAQRSRINFFNKNIFIFMLLSAISIRIFLAYFNTIPGTFLKNIVQNDAVGFHIYAQNLAYNFSISNMIQLFDFNNGKYSNKSSSSSNSQNLYKIYE